MYKHLFLGKTKKNIYTLNIYKCFSELQYTAIPYRASTGLEQGFPCVLFPHREKPVFITGVMGLPLFVVVVVFCFLAGDANDKLTFICTYLNVKQFY